MSTSSNKNSSKDENENNSDSDYEMSKEELSNAHSSDHTSNHNSSQDDLIEIQKNDKNKLADKIKKETDLYMHKQNQSKEDRLKFLLNQTKTYANFLMSGKLEDKESKNRKLLSKKKRKNSEAEINVEDIKVLQNNNIDEDELKIDKEFIKTEKYMTCDGFEFERKLAARFYRRFLISNEMDYAEGSFFNLLHCAWVCDDAKDIENARKIRMLSLPYIDSMIALDDDRKKDYLLMKADVLRRSGQFDQLIDEYRDVIFGEEIYDKVITFQIQKANLGDDACYTVEDVVNP